MQIHTWPDSSASLSSQQRSTLVRLGSLFGRVLLFVLTLPISEQRPGYFVASRLRPTAGNRNRTQRCRTSAGHGAWRGCWPEVASGTPTWRSQNSLQRRYQVLNPSPNKQLKTKTVQEEMRASGPAPVLTFFWIITEFALDSWWKQRKRKSKLEPLMVFYNPGLIF